MNMTIDEMKNNLENIFDDGGYCLDGEVGRAVFAALDELERLHTRLKFWENDGKYKARSWMFAMFADLGDTDAPTS